jgi:hypothetical protein
MRANSQFSLAALFTVTMIGVPLVLGIGIPAYHAARSIAWNDPALGLCLVAGAFFVGVSLLLAIFYRS